MVGEVPHLPPLHAHRPPSGEAVRAAAVHTNPANPDEHRVQLGATWCYVAHNLNVKGAYTRGTLSRLPVAGVEPPAYTQNGFTVQAQAFYY